MHTEFVKNLDLIRSTPPDRIALVTDFDSTIVHKPEKNFHFVQITHDQYRTLRAANDSLAAVVVLTARGHESCLSGIFADRAAFPICLASNSGHYISLNATRPEEIKRIPLIGWNDTDVDLTTGQIRMLLDGIGCCFGGHPVDHNGAMVSCRIINLPNEGGQIILDQREVCCGAVVFEGVSSATKGDIIQAYNSQLKRLIPAAMQSRIDCATKFMAAAGGRHNGYIDIKPSGMDKGHTSVQIMQLLGISDRLRNDGLYIVAGDSAPDLAMMHAMTNLHGPQRVVSVWVGDDPSIHQQVGLNTLILPGPQEQAIHRLYDVILAASAKPD